MKPIRFRLLMLGLILFVTILTGCSKDDSPSGPSSSGGFMPMTIGNYWVYEMKMYQNDILVSTRTDTLIKYDTSFTYNGFTWYGQKGDSSFNRNGDEGVWGIDIIGDTLGAQYLGFKANGQVGDTWTYQTNDGSTTVRINSITANATTPSGTYTGCHQYRETYSNTDTPMDTWMKAGIGPVQFVSEEGAYRMEIKLKVKHIL